MHATATSDQKHPYINLCGIRDHCMKTVHDRVELSCSFHKTRPAVDVRWFTWVSNGIIELNTTQVVSVENNQLYSTRTNLLISESSNLFDMYSCRASGPPLSPATVESFIVIHNNQITSKFEGVQIEQVTLLLYGSANLSCHKSENLTAATVLWKLGHSFSTLKEIAHSYYIKNHRQRYSKAKLMFDDHTGDITVRDVTQRDHGTIYMCFSNVNGREAATAYSIFVIVPPSPPYIRIDGCHDTMYRCLKRRHKGKIVCKVLNVFPKVTLQPYTTAPDLINFSNIETITETNGNNYDVTLVFNYTVDRKVCNFNVPLTCIAVGEPAVMFPFRRDVIVKENCVTSVAWSDVAITERDNVEPSTASSLKTTDSLTVKITCVVTVLFHFVNIPLSHSLL
ncbi:uncharacterized protein [Apostichopus japonicus]|uniref:uncharacterized protein n=1 Tax=Stichopus japonicus TaxID=307972 RepID=UPI003AB78B60